MNKPARARRWFQLRPRAARPAVEDPADYGTAFGLDLSLEALAPAPEPKQRTGWLHRLFPLRRKPAT